MPTLKPTAKPVKPNPASTSASEVLMLGVIPVTTSNETPDRLAILLWGAATCGKTTFAATAPGKKLWISFGDNEHVSVVHRPDVLVANVSDLAVDDLFKHAQNDNPFGLDQLLRDNTEIATVVVDSLTAIEYRALQKSVQQGIGGGRNFRPTMEAPGISAYGGRNAIVLEVVTGILRVTAKHGVHVIFTAHENDPTMVKQGNEVTDIIDFIGIMLGGKIVNSTTWRFSEIWFMSQSDTGAKSRQLMVRPSRRRKPVKTRMFDSKSPPEFVLQYDPELPDDAPNQMTIASWYEDWRENGKQKIAIPQFSETPKVKNGK